MLKQLLKPEIEELINLRMWADLREVLLTWSPAEIAELMLDIERNDRVLLYRALPRDLAFEVFEYLEYDQQESLLLELSDSETRELLEGMSPDDRTTLLEELPGVVTRKLLALLSPEELHQVRQLLGYPEESVGRLMTPDFVSVRPHWTVKQAIDHIKIYGKDSETINRIYVRDDQGKLLDDIVLRTIILADEQQKVESIMTYNVIKLYAHEDQEEAVRMMDKYDMPALPVVDSQGVLVGIVTFDDVFDVAEEEATEDIQKLGGMDALEEPYIQAPLWHVIRKRAGWLTVLFVGEMLTTSVMAYFEGAIQRAVVLALFLPLIMSSGGNSGSQAATLMVRSLAMGEVELRDWLRVMRREIISGVVLGLILGVVGFLRVVLAAQISNVYGEHYLQVAMVIGISLVGVVMWGSLSGSMLPFLLVKLGLDPAASSAPFVATLVDVTGIVIYFVVAVSILTGTLL